MARSIRTDVPVVAVDSVRLGSTRRKKSRLKRREQLARSRGVDEYMASIATAVMRSGTGTDVNVT
jgi:hypothetical protein